MLDDRGLAAARAAAAHLPADRWRQLTAPSTRCRQTADALGLLQAADEPALRDCDMGTWRGRSLSDVLQHEQAAFTAWCQDPSAEPPDGESRFDFAARIAAWLDRMDALASSARLEGGENHRRARTVAVAEPGVVRMAVLHALSAPPEAFWRIDVPPLAVTQLVGKGGRWNVRATGLHP
ncbi:histidine phosphatase family protein [Streptomyces sp. NPDC051776]|uniref:histidine phosphatase family protein n=1 Tax=Streptomyces sp. NPDC051776 TaxID=3155414 RepID=UPI00343DA982